MNTYTYDGPVRIFDQCVNRRWTGSTRAVSERKARSNLAFQYKKQTGRSMDTRVILSGKISVEKGG